MSDEIAKVRAAELDKPSKSVAQRLQTKFVKDLLDDYQAHGIEAIRVMRDERPAEYIKVVASLMPKEIELGETLVVKVLKLADADDMKLIEHDETDNPPA